MVNMEKFGHRFNDIEDGVKVRHVASATNLHQEEYTILDLQIKNGLSDIANSVCQQNSEQNTLLFRYSDIPTFLKGNPYVVSGYRVLLPFTDCCRSVFTWNNETLNIWSHLGGFLLFFLLTIYDNVIGIPENNGTISDHIIVTLGLMCFQFCLLCSAGYHTFMCHSERASQRWLALDLTGISVGLIGCYLPGIHYAFYCLSVWRDLYLIIITVLFSAVMVFQTQSRFLTSSGFYRRLLIYIGLVGYGILPTIHWVYLNGGLRSKLVQLFLPKVTGMYVLGLLAFIFYVTKLPERILPGRFDFVGSSHQLWHMIVVIAFFWWHQAGRDIMVYRTSTPCL